MCILIVAVYKESTFKMKILIGLSVKMLHKTILRLNKCKKISRMQIKTKSACRLVMERALKIYCLLRAFQDNLSNHIMTIYENNVRFSLAFLVHSQLKSIVSNALTHFKLISC